VSANEEEIMWKTQIRYGSTEALRLLQSLTIVADGMKKSS